MVCVDSWAPAKKCSNLKVCFCKKNDDGVSYCGETPVTQTGEPPTEGEGEWEYEDEDDCNLGSFT